MSHLFNVRQQWMPMPNEALLFDRGCTVVCIGPIIVFGPLNASCASGQTLALENVGIMSVIAPFVFPLPN